MFCPECNNKIFVDNNQNFLSTAKFDLYYCPTCEIGWYKKKIHKG